MGRKKGVLNGQGYKDSCTFCEGTKFHWGKKCGACDGTGSENVRKQLVKVYNAKNGIKIRSNLKAEI
jgi:DnaJ-class molecular chaperone